MTVRQDKLIPLLSPSFNTTHTVHTYYFACLLLPRRLHHAHLPLLPLATHPIHTHTFACFGRLSYFCCTWALADRLWRRAAWLCGMVVDVVWTDDVVGAVAGRTGFSTVQNNLHRCNLTRRRTRCAIYSVFVAAGVASWRRQAVLLPAAGTRRSLRHGLLQHSTAPVKPALASSLTLPPLLLLFLHYLPGLLFVVSSTVSRASNLRESGSALSGMKNGAPRTPWRQQQRRHAVSAARRTL